MSGEIKSAVLFNRALLWVVLMHLTTSKVAAIMFTVCAVMNIIGSLAAAWKEAQ